jgi:hypothetical protein
LILSYIPSPGGARPPGEYILSLADDSELSPSDPLHPRQFIKVLVSAEDRQPVLDRKGRDPGIVSRDWSTQPFQCRAQGRIGFGRFLGNRQEIEVAKMGVKPFLVGFAMPGSHDAVSKLTEHNDRNGGSMLRA